MSNIEAQLKDISGITDIKNIRERSIIKVTYEENGRILLLNIQMPSENKVEEESVKLFREYIALYPEIKPLNYLIKIMLRNMGILNNPNGGLSSYGLIVLLCSYVKAQHEIQELEKLGTAEILLRFLHTFGF